MLTRIRMARLVSCLALLSAALVLNATTTDPCTEGQSRACKELRNREKGLRATLVKGRRPAEPQLSNATEIVAAIQRLFEVFERSGVTYRNTMGMKDLCHAKPSISYHSNTGTVEVTLLGDTLCGASFQFVLSALDKIEVLQTKPSGLGVSIVATLDPTTKQETRSVSLQKSDATVRFLMQDGSETVLSDSLRPIEKWWSAGFDILADNQWEPALFVRAQADVDEINKLLSSRQH
jgi:hypothetical protein